MLHPLSCFFFNHTATTEIYTLSLHDALPISRKTRVRCAFTVFSLIPSRWAICLLAMPAVTRDRKSTRLNSSHTVISYAVFCLKKKKPEQRKDVRLQYQRPRCLPRATAPPPDS